MQDQLEVDTLPVDVNAPVVQPGTDTGRSRGQTTGNVGRTGNYSPGNANVGEFKGIIRGGPTFIRNPSGDSDPDEVLYNLAIAGLLSDLPVKAATGAVAGTLNISGL